MLLSTGCISYVLEIMRTPSVACRSVGGNLRRGERKRSEKDILMRIPVLYSVLTPAPTAGTNSCLLVADDGRRTTDDLADDRPGDRSRIPSSFSSARFRARALEPRACIAEQKEHKARNEEVTRNAAGCLSLRRWSVAVAGCVVCCVLYLLSC